MSLSKAASSSNSGGGVGGAAGGVAGGGGYKYSREEVTALKSLFDSVDRDRTGRIHINQLPGLLSKLGKDEGTFFS
jgi:hypothetical protein